MEYCKRCCYPANAQPNIIFDDEGICSGCRVIDKRPHIDWVEREIWLKDLLEEHKAKAREAGNPYDCLIPVSGGKDSTYQVHLMKNIYGMNPLLVSYNHLFNTRTGVRNLTNLVKKLSCDLVRFSSNPDSVRKVTRYMLERVGDVTWHYHAGIMTFPIQTAVRYRIPLVIWGEEGFSELTGMFNQDDMVEFTKKKRQEHDMRGFEPEDLLAAPSCPLEMRDLAPYFYPPDEAVESLGLRGIYLSNYIHWNARAQTDFVIENYDFETAPGPRERTFNVYDKLDDIHANGAHDYLKYLKFGYGRATDDASTEIRHGRMSREEGCALVAKHDPARPSDLDIYLKFVGMTEEEFEALVEPMRDPRIWSRGADGQWKPTDSIVNHVNESGVEEARLLSVGKNQGFRINSKDVSDDPRYTRGVQTDYVYL